MSTAQRTTQQTMQTTPVPVVAPVSIPRLQNGDRLTRVEFERRYLAMPEVKKAQLIEGIVYMPSPVRYTQHAGPHAIVMGWLTHYVCKAPQIKIGDNGTSRLDEDNEPHPDAMLLLPKHMGGTAWIDDDGYVSGAPDFVCEVSASSVSIDMHAKLNAYRRNGVREYLVIRTEDQAVDWFELVDGQYQPQTPDAQTPDAQTPDDSGRLSSKLFPGLWLDTAALLAGDLAKLFACVDKGTATTEHQEFVKKLEQK